MWLAIKAWLLIHLKHAAALMGLYALKYLLSKGKMNMSMSKDLAVGPGYSVKVLQENGSVSLSASASLDLGGGQAKGAVSAALASSVTLHELQLADLGLEVLMQKLPSLAPELGLVKLALDAELAKI